MYFCFVQVSWWKDGAQLEPSSKLQIYQRHPSTHLLVVKNVSPEDMGNYTCVVSSVQGKVMDQTSIQVDKLPPPPRFLEQPDSQNATSQLLSWRGESGLPIIQFLLDFRLSPMSGPGEDWVSLVIPYQKKEQSYLIRGLSPGTRYEARLRTRTRYGKSAYSETLRFNTYSPWTTHSYRITTTQHPATEFSLLQRGKNEPDASEIEQRRKEKGK